MEMNGEYRIPASREKVWEALNDPEILARAVPGCEEIDKLSDTEMTATVSAKVGPVKAKFVGKVVLDTTGAPDQFSLTGTGNGGVAGFAKGGADVLLEDVDGQTLLKYTAKAEIGGKIAQLGSRLMTSTAKKLAGKFFARFAELVDETQTA